MISPDSDTVRDFFEAIHAAAGAACAGIDRPGLLQLIRIHPSGGPAVVSGRFQIGDVEHMVAAAIADAKAGFNSYVEPRTVRQDAPKRGSAEDTRAVYAVVVDRDAYSGKAGRDFADPTLRVGTSPGSGHDWYLLKQAIPAEEAQTLGVGLRAATGADSATGKPTQPYRVAGTPNFPNAKKQALGRNVCSTHFANGGPRYSANELHDLIGAISVKTATIPTVSPFETERTGVVSPRVEKLLSAPAGPTTDRSATLFAAVRAAVEDGMTAGDFAVLAREFPNGCASKYLSPRDRLQQEIARVWEPHAAHIEKLDASGAINATELLKTKPAKKPILPVLRASDLYGQLIPPRRWLVVDVLPGRNVTLLQGDGATGKSLLALMLAVATVRGASWIGLEPIQRGPAVYLSAEDELPELHRRLDNIAQHHNVSLQEFSDLHLIPLAGDDAVLAAPVGRSNIIEASPLFAALRTCVSEIKPRLVVLDTLADLFAGEENQRTQARQFISLLRRLALDNDLCVLLLGHPSLEGLRSGSGTSGSTGWNNSVRSRLYFERVVVTEGNKVIEQDEDVRELTVKKANYGRKAEPVRLKWVDGVFERQTGGVFGLDSMQRNAVADDAFVRLLRLHERLGMPVSPNASSIYAPVVFASHSQAGGVTKRAFKAAMERLLETGKIRVIREGPPSKRRIRLTSYAEENS
jgi:RecA-family ATPase